MTYTSPCYQQKSNRRLHTLQHRSPITKKPAVCSYQQTKHTHSHTHNHTYTHIL